MMYNEYDEQERKQKYLRLEILDKGFDGEEFLEFLTSRKENGGDINNWTFNDLIEEVNEFKENHYAKEKTNEDMIDNFKELSKSILLNEEQANQVTLTNVFEEQGNHFSNDNEEEKKEENNSNENEQHEENEQVNIKKSLPQLTKLNENKTENKNIMKINCLGIEISPLSKETNLKIKITNVEKIKAYEKAKGINTIFSFIKGEVLYYFTITTITTKELSVKRKYKDFFWLRDRLIDLYPGIYIPPLPKKKLDENTQIQKIQKRQKEIETFLNSLINDPLLLGSDILYSFLCIQDEEDFKNMKNIYEQMKVKKIAEYHSRNNQIEIDLLSLNEDKIAKTKANISGSISKLVLLRNSFKMLKKEMKVVSTRMNEISDLFQGLSELSSLFNTDVIELKKNFELLKNLMMYYSIFQDNLKNNINNIIYNNFKQTFNEYLALNSFFQKSLSVKKMYEESKLNLMMKKEELFNKGEIRQWKLANPAEYFNYKDKNLAFEKMLPTETMYLKGEKTLYLYYIQSFIEEFLRVRTIISNNMLLAMKDYYEKNSIDIDAFNEFWKSYKLKLQL